MNFPPPPPPPQAYSIFYHFTVKLVADQPSPFRRFMLQVRTERSKGAGTFTIIDEHVTQLDESCSEPEVYSYAVY